MNTKDDEITDVTITLSRAVIKRIEHIAGEWHLLPGFVVSSHIEAWAEGEHVLKAVEEWDRIRDDDDESGEHLLESIREWNRSRHDMDTTEDERTEVTITLSRAVIERLEGIAGEWLLPVGFMVSAQLEGYVMADGLCEEVEYVHRAGVPDYDPDDYHWDVKGQDE